MCDAVRDCWVSLYSTPAISYRARLARAREEPAMGVTVQLMVDAAVSGVMFTCNPVSGDPSMVAINASWGLGLAVVGGEVTPDDYLVSKITREVVREHIHDKQVEYVPDPGGRGAVRVDIPQERRERPCLDGPAISRARRRGAGDRAPLRLPSGRRVGARPRERRAVCGAIEARDRCTEARQEARAEVGDRGCDEHVRRRRRHRRRPGGR